MLGTETVDMVKSTRTGYASIYHVDCEILIQRTVLSKRCSACTRHRKSLMAMKVRPTKDTDVTNPSSHTTYTNLHTSDKDKRLHRMQQDKKRAKLYIERLRLKIAESSESSGVVVDQEMHDNLKTMATEYTRKVHESCSEDSFKRLFWDQQHKASSLKNSKSMSWHPLFIKWCLYLRHLSGSSYDMLRESGCIKLPSQRTLRDYTYYVSTNIGFSDEVDKQLVDMMDLSQERNRYLVLVMDEMHIKEELVYDKHLGTLVGFVNLGETNNHLLRFEDTLSTSEKPRVLASSLLVFMVRALFHKFNFPYVQFACDNTSADLLVDPVMEATFRLERQGLHVLALTCDGGSANRRLWKLLSSDEFAYKVPNPYAEDRYLYLISDPPHLLKTIRNSWSSKVRKLWVCFLSCIIILYKRYIL